ncbi:MAG: glycosyltransferase family 4 protein [Halothiobacillus sp.]|nr:glycosyltransferase family 4 protein [Halothiobacillus sp.]
MMISSLSSGGAERVATTLANYWAEKGWEISIITLASTERDFYTVAPSVKRVPLCLTGESRGPVSGLWNNIARVRALRRVLLQEQPDIALGFMSASNILCGLACIGTGIVAIGSEHNHPPMFPLGQQWGALRRLVYPRLVAVSALTEKSAEWIRDHTGATNVPVMPNPILYPIPAGEPARNPAEVKARLGGDKYLFAAGRLAYEKGFDRLLAAFAQVHARRPDWRLVVLGEGPLREDLEQQCDDLGLSEVVALPGAVGNIGEWYQASDAYVMTSRYEGFGNTLAEALAYGLPAVAVDCETGPREILRHELDGLLVPQDDPDALVSALDRLMADGQLRSRFSESALEARPRFAVERVAAMWEELFSNV